MRESKFTPIDYENWERKDIYEDYKGIAFFVTCDFDVTRYIREYKGKIKFYPYMIYIVSRLTNEHEEFRMAIEDGKVGYYDVVHPLYTLLRENKLFTHKVTDYSEDFVDFYKRIVADKEMAEHCNALYADGYRPNNVVAVSTMPHTVFTNISFTYDMSDITEYVPFPTFGRYYERDGRWYCPIAIEFFHGVNDGYHAEQYIKYLQELLDGVDIDVSAL